jgi:zinc/manganese transport system permease protein
MVNAYRAGSIVAIVCGLVGWLLVLRGQTFAAHTVAVAGFPGAAGAVLIGAGPSWGYYGACIGAALAIAAARGASAGGPARDSALTGVVQAFALACGMLFVSLYHGFLKGINALLFGTFLGVTDRDVKTVAVAAVAVLSVLAVIGRPLLFASIDPAVAAARGVPGRALGVVFLVVVGTAVAQVSQITGSLLVFALLVTPAATAQRLTARPVLGLGLSVAIALTVTWLGLGAAYFSPYPIGFFITTFAFTGWVLATAGTAAVGRPPRAARTLGAGTDARQAA